MTASPVISRAGDMPRRVFSDVAVAQGRFPNDPDAQPAAWEAECAAAFGTQAYAAS